MKLHPFYSFIREARTQLGITQSELSHLSKVSLPTIQNIESGKGNPSLSTLEDLLVPLGRTLHLKLLKLQKADWNVLAVCGAPLMVEKPTKMKPTREQLVSTLRMACLELTKASSLDQISDQTPYQQPDMQRKTESVAALLWAIQAHYPTFFANHFNLPLFKRLLPLKPTGRHIKLKRQALATLSTYL